jgi:glycosyltransferase involved in cell wall biosynthesis
MNPIILTFVGSYLPGFKAGGPIRTISNMVAHLGDDLDFRIVTLDRDGRDEARYAGISVGEWNQVGKAQVLYRSPADRGVTTLARLIQQTPHDVLYLNSFFSPVFTLQPLLARRMGRLPPKPTVLAPRGEFSAGALALKQWKKAPYLRVSRLLGLYRDLVWQASSEHEVEDIRRHLRGLAQRIIVAPNLTPVELPQASSRIRAPGEPLKIAFLSRISQKKNLDFALEVLTQVDVPLEFHVYGPIDDREYWEKCREAMQRLPEKIHARYHGVVSHEDVPAALSGHDLFFLPTRGENYGHAIVEAWAAGLPVLISDQTPWRGLEQLGIGWELPLNNESGFASVIERLARMEPEAWPMLRERAASHAAKIVEDQRTRDANLYLFAEAIRLGSRAGHPS